MDQENKNAMKWFAEPSRALRVLAALALTCAAPAVAGAQPPPDAPVQAQPPAAPGARGAPHAAPGRTAPAKTTRFLVTVGLAFAYSTYQFNEGEAKKTFRASLDSTRLRSK